MDEYRSRMEEKGLREEEGEGVQESWEKLKESIWEVGKELKMVKAITQGRE